MFAKKFRLKTKEVLFLTKKKQYFGSGLFGFFYVQQYPNLKYNQISFHVSIKYNKHATARNIIKRAVVSRIQAQKIDNINGIYYKIFITLNKNRLEELQKQVANLDKKHIIAIIQAHLAKSFTVLQDYLGRSSKTFSNTEQRYSRHSDQKTNNN